MEHFNAVEGVFLPSCSFCICLIQDFIISKGLLVCYAGACTVKKIDRLLIRPFFFCPPEQLFC